MNFALPKCSSQMRLIVRATGWDTAMYLDDSFSSVDVELPTGTDEQDVEAFVEYLDGKGALIGNHVIKTKKRPKLPPRQNP